MRRVGNLWLRRVRVRARMGGEGGDVWDGFSLVAFSDGV